jgi:phosphoribosyl-ATP pyrophosphohydrolase
MPNDVRKPSAGPEVLNRLWTVIDDHRDADPKIHESARMLEGGTAKLAQKFGEEALGCILEAAGGNRAGVIEKSSDVLYNLLTMWVDAGIRPHEIWLELEKREHPSAQTHGPNGSVSRMFKSVQFIAPKGT